MKSVCVSEYPVELLPLNINTPAIPVVLLPLVILVIPKAPVPSLPPVTLVSISSNGLVKITFLSPNLLDDIVAPSIYVSGS